MPPSAAGPHEVRRRHVVIAAVLCLALIVALVMVLVARDGARSSADPSDAPTPSPATPIPSPTAAQTPTPTPTGTSSSTGTAAPPVTTQGRIDNDDAEELVGSYVERAATADPDDPHAAEQVAAIAGDGIIAELQADLLELDSNGWTRTGTPRVVSASVTEQDDTVDPPTATVEACIDSSDVRVIDSAGDPLPTSPASARALNLYTVSQQDDGSWILVSHSFPNDPAC